MSLISVMYHHANSDLCSNDVEILNRHLEYISKNFKAIFPGEEVTKNSICLTFDDGYADFYFLIFPLLKKYGLKATLAVPTKFILDDTKLSPKERMSFKHNDIFKNYQKAPFCTFKEMDEMIKSGLVKIASHSHSHVVLSDENINLDEELLLSKEILEKKLKIDVDSFFFPFGKYNKDVLKEAKKHYKYIFRIGNALQKDFEGINGVIYRVKGDGLKSFDEIFRGTKLFKYWFKGLIKRVFKR